ncbi:hypothetical protein LMF57_19545 [Stenotrophomonas sp. SI-NJAU-1]|uniref:hypothetical protein n=1 Tax=Stenotrophomonas TaxID=40323 RepID=UPI001AA14332|nr:hypothetical protein [Stenotrophomonas sp. SI-NJAU-1]MBO1746383.1 hypothetical protein [Stenotrophomonas indicatrix]UEX18172.1 hypothetical protein LMF57_19545 [Stenotrophomonas sp. SI-NJAU-1]
MSRPTDSREPDERALSQALHEQARQDEMPDVSEALQKRIASESRDSSVGYAVVQIVLLGALVAGGVWYFWH